LTRTREAHERIKAELAQEKAAALGRAGEGLEDALAIVIQREAVGLRHHRVVDQQFPEPPRRTSGTTPAAS
jgi:hypothetical protein